MNTGGITEDGIVHHDDGHLVSTRDMIKMLKVMQTHSSDSDRVERNDASGLSKNAGFDVGDLVDRCAKAVMTAARRDTVIDAGNVIYPTEGEVARIVTTWRAGGFVTPENDEGGVIAFQAIARDGVVNIPPTIALVSISGRSTHIATISTFIEDDSYQMVLTAYFIVTHDDSEGFQFQMAPVKDPPMPDTFAFNVFLTVLQAMDAAAASKTGSAARH